MKRYVTYCLLALMICGCRVKRVEQRRAIDSIHLQSVEATSIGGTVRESSLERVTIVSVMQLDTATGTLRETERTTKTEKTTSNEVEKIENKAQNNAVETFSSESEAISEETQENAQNGLKTGFRLGWWSALILLAAIGVGFVYLRLKTKSRIL